MKQACPAAVASVVGDEDPPVYSGCGVGSQSTELVCTQDRSLRLGHGVCPCMLLSLRYCSSSTVAKPMHSIDVSV